MLNLDPLNVFGPLSTLQKKNMVIYLPTRVLKNLTTLYGFRGGIYIFNDLTTDVDEISLYQGLVSKQLDHYLSYLHIEVHEKQLEAIYEDTSSDDVIFCHLY